MKVEAYKAQDGSLHETEELMNQHNAELERKAEMQEKADAKRAKNKARRSERATIMKHCKEEWKRLMQLDLGLQQLHVVIENSLTTMYSMALAYQTRDNYHIMYRNAPEPTFQFNEYGPMERLEFEFYWRVYLNENGEKLSDSKLRDCIRGALAMVEECSKHNIVCQEESNDDEELHGIAITMFGGNDHRTWPAYRKYRALTNFGNAFNLSMEAAQEIVVADLGVQEMDACIEELQQALNKAEKDRTEVASNAIKKAYATLNDKSELAIEQMKKLTGE